MLNFDDILCKAGSAKKFEKIYAQPVFVKKLYPEFHAALIASTYRIPPTTFLHDRAPVKTGGVSSFYEPHNFIISPSVQKRTRDNARGNLGHYARYTHTQTHA